MGNCLSGESRRRREERHDPLEERHDLQRRRQEASLENPSESDRAERETPLGRRSFNLLSVPLSPPSPREVSSIVRDSEQQESRQQCVAEFHNIAEQQQSRGDRSALNLRPPTDMEELKSKFQEILDDVKFENVEAEYSGPDHIREEVGNKKSLYRDPPEKDRQLKEQMNKLAEIHKRAQGICGPGIKVLARFYVEDAESGKSHPGINSWASLPNADQNSSPNTPEEISKIAKNHMKYGHDTGDKDVTKASPFVSTTGDVAKLLLADSQYNNNILMSRVNSQAGPRGERNVAKYYSEKIDLLMYGNAHKPAPIRQLSHVANKIAFLAIRANSPGTQEHLFTPDMVQEGRDDKYDCYRLEDEHTIYTPSQNLKEFVLGEVNNVLPEVKQGSI